MNFIQRIKNYIQPELKVESREFWIKVQEEYALNLTYRGPIQICSSSKIFRKAHEKDSILMSNLATAFLNETSNSHFYCTSVALFYSHKFISKPEQLKIRIDFINWCIRKYSK